VIRSAKGNRRAAWRHIEKGENKGMKTSRICSAGECGSKALIMLEIRKEWKNYALAARADRRSTRCLESSTE
jgi:hypothetical protein